LLKNLKKTQILGIIFIVLSWIFWGLILVVPFLKLGLRSTSIAITILFIGSNIFWPGVLLAGKELLPKFKIFPKLRGKVTKDSFNNP
jgi:hypothetical protein